MNFHKRVKLDVSTQINLLVLRKTLILFGVVILNKPLGVLKHDKWRLC